MSFSRGVHFPLRYQVQLLFPKAKTSEKIRKLKIPPEALETRVWGIICSDSLYFFLISGQTFDFRVYRRQTGSARFPRLRKKTLRRCLRQPKR